MDEPRWPDLGRRERLQVCLPLLGRPPNVPILDPWVVIAHGEATQVQTVLQPSWGAGVIDVTPTHFPLGAGTLGCPGGPKK